MTDSYRLKQLDTFCLIAGHKIYHKSFQSGLHGYLKQIHPEINKRSLSKVKICAKTRFFFYLVKWNYLIWLWYYIILYAITLFKVEIDFCSCIVCPVPQNFRTPKFKARSVKTQECLSISKCLGWLSLEIQNWQKLEADSSNRGRTFCSCVFYWENGFFMSCCHVEFEEFGVEVTNVVC